MLHFLVLAYWLLGLSQFAFAQSSPLAKLESISFSPKKWTVPQLISAIQQGASGVQRLSPSSKVSYTPEDRDMEDMYVNPYYSFSEEGITIKMYFPDETQDNRDFANMIQNGMVPLSEVRAMQKGAEFTVNGQVIKVGDIFDDYSFLMAIEQSHVPAYKESLPQKFNYAILIAEDGSGLFIRSSDGWGSRMISEMIYAPNVAALRIFDGVFNPPFSQIELEYIVGEANKIIKKGTYMADILGRMNRLLSSAINDAKEGGKYYYTLAEQRTFLVQAKAEREAGQKAVEEVRLAERKKAGEELQRKIAEEEKKLPPDVPVDKKGNVLYTSPPKPTPVPPSPPPTNSRDYDPIELRKQTKQQPTGEP